MFVALAASLWIGLIQNAAAQNPPSGSYQQTCQDASVSTVNGTSVLTATCETTTGLWMQSQLVDYTQCQGEPANLDGTLACNIGGSPPAGSYTQTCRNEWWDQGTLNAECQTLSGVWQQTQLANAGQCQQAPSNLDGTLACNIGGSPPSGSYTQTCRDEWVNNGTLMAECLSSSGQWLPTQLPDFAHCQQPPSNLDGTLACNIGGSPPSGPYTQTCRDEWVNNGTLMAECQTPSGQWIPTSLTGYVSCLSAPVNLGGILACATEAPASQVPAASNSGLSGFADNTGEHVYFASTSGDIQEFSYSGAWYGHDLTLATNGAQAAPASSVSSFSDATGDHVYFVASNMHVHQLWRSSTNWYDQDLTAATNGAVAIEATALTSFADNMGEHVYFLAAGQHVHQLWWNKSAWADQDLTSATSGAPAATGSSLSSFSDNTGEHVYFLAAGQHVHQLWWNKSAWADQDLTSATSGAPAATGSSLSSFSDNDGEHGYFLSANQHLQQMYWDNVAWFDQDLTSSVGPPLGSYTQTCQTILQSGLSLTAVCNTGSGTSINSSLSNYSFCSGDISNQNGILECATSCNPGTAGAPQLFLVTGTQLSDQEQSQWCWAASGKMVMGYWGTYVDQCSEVNRATGLTTCCGHLPWTIPVESSDVAGKNCVGCNCGGSPPLASYGFTGNWNTTPLTWSQLTSQLSCQNAPFYFAWNWGGGGAHVMVVYGYEVDDGLEYVWILNPEDQDPEQDLYSDWSALPNLQPPAGQPNAPSCPSGTYHCFQGNYTGIAKQ